jgi:hypothetical protein
MSSNEPTILVEHTARGQVEYAFLKEGQVAPPGHSIFTYRWRHLKTGNSGLEKICVLRRDRFIDLLMKWNTQQPGVWEYAPMSEE